MLVLKSVQLILPGYQIHANFKVAPGDIVGLAGPSGCGKSTLIRWIAGLPIPGEFRGSQNSGELWLDQRMLFGQRKNIVARKRNLGVVFQELGLFSEMNVASNVAFRYRVQGNKKLYCDELGVHLLEKLNLAHLAKRSVDTLSGGEKQRVALLRAWAGSPDALLLDEPFAALDDHSKSQVHDALQILLKERPIPVIMVSHQRSDFLNFQARVVELQERVSSEFPDAVKLRYFCEN